MLGEERYTSVTITLPADYIKFLDEVMAAKDMTRSQAIRAAIRLYQEHETLQTQPPVIVKGKLKEESDGEQEANDEAKA